ncbi:hypothetical protein H0H81_011219 [Sphagnurus paluster]|uniref:Uncharacterized protein n=1 Tax=Sphagnurus paluster TaxID=117069 RepID=A0A9P7G1B5_9AGAR|nr:hypothetical protein H0H81_011219 [Sphagnurus paluster]
MSLYMSCKSSSLFLTLNHHHLTFFPRLKPSPAESTRPAPSRPVSPVYQTEYRCDTPDQGYLDFQYTMEHCGNDSSSELEYQEEAPPSRPLTTCDHNKAILDHLSALEGLKNADIYIDSILTRVIELSEKISPTTTYFLLAGLPFIKGQIALAVDKAKTRTFFNPPHPTPHVEMNSPTTPTGPKPPGATPLTRGTQSPPAPPSGAPALTTTPLASAPTPAMPPMPPAAPAPRGGHAPPPPNQLRPHVPPNVPPLLPPHNRHLSRLTPRPSGQSPLAPARPTRQQSWWPPPQPMQLTANPVPASTSGEFTSPTSAATPAYSTIIANALATISGFSSQGATVIPYRLAARLQIKGLPTWDPTTNRPVELTSVYQTLNGLGIFEGVELIKNSPAPSDALSWARDSSTFNAKLRPCAVAVRFFNNDGRETGALLKKAFYLLGHRCRFDK